MKYLTEGEYLSLIADQVALLRLQELQRPSKAPRGRWYLAGPMTGHPELNHPLFHAEAARLRGLGYEVINPAEINGDQTARWEDCMRCDIAHLVRCDGIALLPGWHHSRGARLEHGLAVALSMRVCCVDELEGAPAC